MVRFVDVILITILHVFWSTSIRAYVDRPVSRQAEERVPAYYRKLMYPV